MKKLVVAAGLLLLAACGGETAPSCPSGTLCDGVCVDTGADAANCGACGAACAEGETCVSGACAVVCPAGFATCEGACFDPMTSPAHCGASADCSDPGAACAEGETCVSGACAVVCPAGFATCDGACFDPQTSPAHCGASADCSDPGEACTGGDVCSAGACAVVCPAGFATCEGACFDPMTSPDHCGASEDCSDPGEACAAGTVCTGGACVPLCTDGLLSCGGVCVDPLTNAQHCGASGDCTGAQAGAACAAGALCVSGDCLSNDPSLTGLSLSAGRLDAPFAPDTLAYVDTLSQLVHTVTVTPTAAAAAATLEVNGVATTSGTPVPVAFDGPAASLSIQVTAPAGASRTYTVALARDAVAYLKAGNLDSGDQLGGAVALDGDTLVVGAQFEQSLTGSPDDDSGSFVGAAYVFVRDDAGTWSQQGYLKASNAESQDRFGFKVAVSGDTVAVSAYGEASGATGVDGDQTDNSVQAAGAVYLFTRDAAGAWSQEAYLKAPNTSIQQHFGGALALEGDTLVVGASGDQSGVVGDPTDTSAYGAGAVFVFERSGGQWSPQAYLKASNLASWDTFGSSVSLSGDTLAVGALGEDSASAADPGDDSADNSGAVYVFTRDAAGAWSEQAYLKASNAEAYDAFGRAVSVDGDVLAVSAPSEAGGGTGTTGDPSDNSVFEAGAVYVFARDAAGAWSQRAYLKPFYPPVESELFGQNLGLGGGLLAVGDAGDGGAGIGIGGAAPDGSLLGAGAVYTYRTDASGAWQTADYVKSLAPDASDGFGYDVCVSRGTVAVGVPREAGSGSDPTLDGTPRSGAVFVF